MSLSISLIISSFQRPNLLKWGLDSLTKQALPSDFEIIVVNDGLPDETESVCQSFGSRLNIRYLFTGRRNLAGGIKWRVPGYAVNIGAQQAKGEILIISCAEMYHLNDTIRKLSEPFKSDRYLLTIPIGKDERDGSFLNLLNNPGSGIFDYQAFLNYPDLNTYLPFLLGVWRDHFLAIGGYDEDFTGIAFDDNDLVDRFQTYGCKFCKTEAMTMHLYHPRYMYQVGMNPQWHYNRNLYLSRKGKAVRNEGRSWGVL